MILGFACAQFVSVARACALDADPARGPASVAAESFGMPADCPFMTGATVHATCEAQCMPPAQVDKGGKARIPLAPPSVLVVHTAASVVPSAARATPPRARIASPPLSLLFCRFLI